MNDTTTWCDPSQPVPLSPGRLGMTCWCERRVFLVPEEWVRMGLAPDCGAPECGPR